MRRGTFRHGRHDRFSARCWVRVNSVVGALLIDAEGIYDPRQIVWQVPSYWAVLSVLKNPTYAGAYAYGRSKNIVRLEEGRKRIARIRHRRCEDWGDLAHGAP
jgi:hypothetical protein